MNAGKGNDTRQRQDGKWSTRGDGREEDGSKWGIKCEEQQGDRRCWPDGDVGALSQPASCALQPSVNLPHLYSPFQANHLQQLVTEIWMVTEKMLETQSEAWFFNLGKHFFAGLGYKCIPFKPKAKFLKWLKVTALGYHDDEREEGFNLQK